MTHLLTDDEVRGTRRSALPSRALQSCLVPLGFYLLFNRGDGRQGTPRWFLHPGCFICTKSAQDATSHELCGFQEEEPTLPGCLRRRWMGRQALLAGQGSQCTQALQGNLLPTWSSTRRAPLIILPQLPPHSIKLGTNWDKKRAQRESRVQLLARPVFFFCSKTWDNGKLTLNLEAWNMDDHSFPREL